MLDIVPLNSPDVSAVLKMFCYLHSSRSSALWQSTLTAGCFFSIFRYRNQIRIISIMTNESLFSSTLQVNNPKKQILSSLVVLTSSEVRLHNCGSFHRSLTPLGLIELIRMPNYRVIPALHRVQQKSSFPKWHTHIISSFSLFVLIEFWNECGGNQSDWLNNEQLQFSVLRNKLQPVLEWKLSMWCFLYRS